MNVCACTNTKVQGHFTLSQFNYSEYLNFSSISNPLLLCLYHIFIPTWKYILIIASIWICNTPWVPRVLNCQLVSLFLTKITGKTTGMPLYTMAAWILLLLPSFVKQNESLYRKVKEYFSADCSTKKWKHGNAQISGVKECPRNFIHEEHERENKCDELN